MSTSYDRRVKLNQGHWAYVRETVLIGQQLGTSLYQLTPSLSKVRQFSWPKFMLPIKFFKFKMCQLAVTDAFHYQCTRNVNKPGFHVEHLCSTNSHRTSVFLLDLLLC